MLFRSLRLAVRDPLAAAPAGTEAALSAGDRAVVAEWDRLATELRAEQAAVSGSGDVPGTISVTDLARLVGDASAFRLDTARPMPRIPGGRQRSGTALHRWIEGHYSGQALFDVDDLPGSADDVAPDPDQARLRAAFLAGDYSGRSPVAVEEPFALALGGRVIRGRIDAVFSRDGRYEVVDWKSGGRGGLAPVQLGVYRLAWALRCGIDVDDVDAAFVLVATGEVVRPEHLPGAGEIEAILSGREPWDPTSIPPAQSP